MIFGYDIIYESNGNLSVRNLIPSNIIIMEKLLKKLKEKNNNGLTEIKIQMLERCKDEYGRWFARLLRVTKTL